MDVTTAQLRGACYADQFERLDGILDEHQQGISPNVAVVAPPFAGRRSLVDYVTDELPTVTTVDLGDDPAETPVPSLADYGPEDAVVIGDCQYLFTRDIGGFEPLSSFLESAALSEPMIVTGWNSHAWDYLDAVRDVGQSFEHVVRLPPVDAVDLSSLIEAHHDGPLPEFVQTGASGRVKTVEFGRSDASLWGERSVSVPTVDLNPEYFLSRSANEVVGDLEAVVYQKLVQVSAGNPGVAAALWDETITDGEVAPSYVPDYDDPLSLDREAAFVLELVVSNGRMDRDTLASIRPEIRVDQALQTLSQQGVVTVDGATARLRPQRLRAAIAHLEGRQLLW